ncbi:MAG: hypothetical protein J2P35_23015, partial [Actinobacteria bacterium]|nr:hypothetical protein [Actinomycetota bacterium]
MRIWVPTAEVAQALAGLPEAAVDVVPADGGSLPAGSGEVGFYVPPFFPDPPAVGEVLRTLPAL